MALVDLNVWFALLVDRHPHHSTAGAWFEGLPPAAAEFCNFTQFGVLRLLTNSSAMYGSPLTIAEAWSTLQTLFEDERVAFVEEPSGLREVASRFLHWPIASPKLVGDAYLAAFSLASNRSLVTLDRGFSQFRGLEVQLL